MDVQSEKCFQIPMIQNAGYIGLALYDWEHKKGIPANLHPVLYDVIPVNPN